MPEKTLKPELRMARLCARLCAGLFITAITGLAFAPAPALADPKVLSDKAGKEWRHKETKLALPGSFGRFTLESVKDWTDSQSDIVATYRDRSTDTLLSVFLFRAGLADVSIWQDRIISTVRANGGGLGNVDGNETRLTPFTPRDGVAGSGSIAAFHLTGGNSQTSGSAVAPFGDWLVAMRMSSGSLDEQALFNALLDFASGLPLGQPAKERTHGASYAITPCSGTVPMGTAKRSEGSMSEALLLSVGLEAALEDRQKGAVEETPAAPWCREATSGKEFSVYSRGNANDGYVIAYNDAGVAIEVSKAISLTPSDSQNYSVALRAATATSFFRGFTSLPSFQQAIDVINSERPIGSVGRTPKTARHISISADTAAKEAKQ
ncbi:hypothetical protein WBP06_07315 [Novosphingobium sp. BL-8H]